jgi:xanthine dehydrogenase accessory factor
LTSIYKALVELEEKGEGGILCTIISSRGSTPRHQGSKMLVYPDGHMIGTVGGGEVENRVLKEALEAYQEGSNRVLTYNMVNPKEGDPGVCGGSLEVFVEPILPRPVLVIIGGGHVGKALAHLAKWLKYKVVISDDREEFCNKEFQPDGDEYYPVAMKHLPENMPITPYTYLVLTTRGSNVDVEGLPALIDCPAAYLGIIGSRRRWLVTRKALLENGIPEEKLNRIHSPIGLELNAETPEEIAVSIMGEIMMIRNGGTGQAMKL